MATWPSRYPIPGKYIVLAPSASFLPKRWPIEYFVSLAERDDAHSGMSMFVVPEALMDKASDADITDKNWMFENSVLTISLRGDKANG